MDSIPAHRAASSPLSHGLSDPADLQFSMHSPTPSRSVTAIIAPRPDRCNRFYLMTGTMHRRANMGVRPSIIRAAPLFVGDYANAPRSAPGFRGAAVTTTTSYHCPVVFHAISDGNAQIFHFENAMRDRPFYELLKGLQTGNIPQVTWIVPPSNVSEHPNCRPPVGSRTNQVLQALWSNPALWPGRR